MFSTPLLFGEQATWDRLIGARACAERCLPIRCQLQQHPEEAVVPQQAPSPVRYSGQGVQAN